VVPAQGGRAGAQAEISLQLIGRVAEDLMGWNEKKRGHAILKSCGTGLVLMTRVLLLFQAMLRAMSI
jgi:hypothetical protein